MLRRRLHSLERDISAVGFGTWPLGGPFIVGDIPIGRREVPEDRALSSLRLALNEGMTFFDTADIYGAGRAEVLLGRAINADQDVVICTKFGNRIAQDKIVQDFSADWIRTAIFESCRRLGVDQIDIVLLHSPPDDFDWQCYDCAPLDELVEMQVIGCYGVSCRSAAGATRVLDAGIGSMIEVIYNVIDRRASDVISRAALQGVDIIARMPLAYGLIVDKCSNFFGTGDHRSALAAEELAWLQHAAKRLAFLDELPGGIVVSAIRFVLSEPHLANVIVGMHREEHVAAAIQAAVLGPLPLDLIERVQNAVPEVFSGWLGSRK